MAGDPYFSHKNHSLSKDGDQRSHFYIWDQFWARSVRVEVVVDAVAQPSRNGSEGEKD